MSISEDLYPSDCVWYLFYYPKFFRKTCVRELMHEKYFEKGFRFSKLKRYEEAIEQYKLAIQYNPSYSRAYNNMGVVLYELNRFEEAMKQYKLAIQYKPSDSSAYNNMARIT